MAIDVDHEAIAERARLRKQQETVGVDLWIALPGCDRHGAVAVIEAAAAKVGRDLSAWLICPTSPATYVWMRRGAAWRTQVDQLAEALGATGHTGTIGVAPVDPSFYPVATDPYPALTMAHTMDPPFEAGPFNVVGRPVVRWGVPLQAQERLLNRAADWSFLPGATVHVGEVIFVPVQRNDLLDVVSLLQLQSRRLSVVSNQGETSMRRYVRFDSWGLSTWTDLDTDIDHVDLARRQAVLLAEFAADLDYGAIHPARAGADDTDRMSTPLWRINRHLWSSFVPDAFGIQLLTSSQLDRAHDLSNWRVDHVAADRWLVSASELAAWFEIDDSTELRTFTLPHPELRDQARADFGSMILTQEAAEARPFADAHD